MRWALYCVIALQSSLCLAVTRVQIFLGGRALVTVGEESTLQTGSPDATALYNLMNEPVQNSEMGPGKAIGTADQEMSFSCATSTSMGPMCSIELNSGPDVTIDAKNNSVQFQLSGGAAAEMSTHWFGGNGLHFVSTDSLLKIDVTPEQFLLKAQSAPTP
jgi:hypothetical protein